MRDFQGVMSQSINWDLLEDQYKSDGVYREKLSKMVTVVDEAFLAGKKFARTMSENMDETNRVPNISVDKTEKGDDVKNVDVTYDEVPNQAKEAAESDKVNVNKQVKVDTSVTDNKKATDEVKVTKAVETNEVKVKEINVTDKKQTDIGDLEMDSIVEELRTVLDEDKISDRLFEKLTGSEKFELDAKDIDELNNINEDRIKACVAVKLKIGKCFFYL